MSQAADQLTDLRLSCEVFTALEQVSHRLQDRARTCRDERRLRPLLGEIFAQQMPLLEAITATRAASLADMQAKARCLDAWMPRGSLLYGTPEERMAASLLRDLLEPEGAAE
ncbi:hypothetical protein [Roseomonas sp. USHLN139]|uniref:hypothetical protein n=1 Tax=Roseomonas sp. USHLN139 TaxID=3081298 RepID=UPI003B022C0B